MFTQDMAKKINASFVAILLCGMTQARPHAAKHCPREYTVKQGDTCDAISASQQVSTYQLASLNPKINFTCTNLAIGDVLCLGKETNDCTTVQVVQQDDTCAKISQHASITVSDLLTNNPNINKDCTNIYVGEVLCVAPASNSTNSSLPGAATLPGFPLGNTGTASPSGTPLDLSMPLGDSGLSGLPLGLNTPQNSGANSPDASLGLNISSDPLGQGSPGLPVAPNAGQSSIVSGNSTSLPIPIPLSNFTLPGMNATTSSTTSAPNALPPLNIPDGASGTPFNIPIPDGVQSSPSIPSGPGSSNGGTNVATSATLPGLNSDSSLGSPGTIEIGPSSGHGSKKSHVNGAAGLYPS